MFYKKTYLDPSSRFILRSSDRRCSVKIGVLRNFTKFTGKHLYQSLCFNKFVEAYNFIKKETLAQVFSCEFCEISKNTFFTEHLWTTASIYSPESLVNLLSLFKHYTHRMKKIFPEVN